MNCKFQDGDQFYFILKKILFLQKELEIYQTLPDESCQSNMKYPGRRSWTLDVVSPELVAFSFMAIFTEIQMILIFAFDYLLWITLLHRHQMLFKHHLEL